MQPGDGAPPFVAYDLPPSLRPLYTRLGPDLPRVNGSEKWRIPLPATFIIGTDGHTVTAHVEALSYRRLEPADAAHIVHRHQSSVATMALNDV